MKIDINRQFVALDGKTPITTQRGENFKFRLCVRELLLTYDPQADGNNVQARGALLPKVESANPDTDWTLEELTLLKQTIMRYEKHPLVMTQALDVVEGKIEDKAVSKKAKAASEDG